MFTFNFTFHVPNPFSISTLTSVANAATDAFHSVATDIREDPELLNYMISGLGPGGVAGGFGYDSNRLVKFPPPSSSASHSPPTSPKAKGSKGSHGRHAFGLGLANPHAQSRKQYLPAHERSRPDFRGSASGFVYVNSPPGSGTPKFPTQTYPSSYLNLGVQGLGQGMPVNHNPLSESGKRGWMPALSEPSYASTNEDFTTGFFDTPKYSDINEMGGVAYEPGLDGREPNGMRSSIGDRRKRDDINEGEGDAMEAELPPAKRRKGLAGSILSTAFSAALVGTAVGLTVYRLWKDRGRADGAPPPYEESQRSHRQTHDSKTLPSHVHSEPAYTNLRTQRKRYAATAGRRAAGNSVRSRKPIPQRFHPIHYSHQPEPSQPPQVQDIPSGHPGPRLGQVEEEGWEEPEHQMDWIGDKISQLIEEGKKALGTEVVVMSDSKEDEVDDGSGLWEDSDGGELGSSTSSRYGRMSPRRKRVWQSLHQTIPGGSSGEFSPSKPPAYMSPTKSTFPGSPNLIQSSAEPVTTLASSTASTTGWMRESESDWQSEELKESMERARAMYMANRGQIVGQAH